MTPSRAALDGYPIEVRSPVDGTGYEIGACALVRGAPEQERENARTFYRLADLFPRRGMLYRSEKSCRLPANSTARAADGLPPLDEVKLITYDLEWAGENRTRLISYFDTHIYSARTKGNTAQLKRRCFAEILCPDFVAVSR